MNRLYKVIWRARQQAWVAVGELAKGHSKSKTATSTSNRSKIRHCLAGSLLLIPATLWANDLPTGGNVTAGQGSISQSGNTMTINQSSDRLSIDWQSFDIGSDSSVTFTQPSSDSAALNRVLNSQVSTIQGALNANGQVFLINPNGIIFGNSAQVDVGGLVASTLDISPEDFMAGNFTFSGFSSNAIINQGNIQAADGGYVAMIAAKIINNGNIESLRGDVLLGSGNRITLDLGGPVKLSIDQGALDGLIEQGGVIKADGGYIYLSGKAANELATSVINHTGVTEAQTLATGEQGQIVLMGDMEVGTANVAGILDGSAPEAGDGGFIETSAAYVKIADDVSVTTQSVSGETGQWLIDPNDFTIAASGGDITGVTLSSNLASTAVTIQSADGGNTNGNGDIFVNDTVSWSANTLTLHAERNIEINTAMNASSSAGLALEYNQGDGGGDYITNAPVNLSSTGSFATKDGSAGTVINWIIIDSLGSAGSTNSADLQGINGNLSGNYVLGADIDASATSSWNSGKGFAPLGGDTNPFTGSFDGLGHTISDLTINRGSKDFVGLFGYSNVANLRNLGLLGGSVTGYLYVGGLVGMNQNSTVRNVFSTTPVTGEAMIGGLIGFNKNSTIDNAYATGNIDANGVVDDLIYTGEKCTYAGGLVGLNVESTINNAYATGNILLAKSALGGLVGGNFDGTLNNVHASGFILVFNDSTYYDYYHYFGGLVGTNRGTITNAYATGGVSSNGLEVGGLAGDNFGTISNSYASGNVSGVWGVGGLVGDNTNSGSLNNVYATGDVMGRASPFNYAYYDAGGLVGSNLGSITNAYATGEVVGETHAGGLVGKNDGPVSNAYATGRVYGNTDVGGLIGYNGEYGAITNVYTSGYTMENLDSIGVRIGVLIGNNALGATISNGYWNFETTGFDLVEGFGNNTGSFTGGRLNSAELTASLPTGFDSSTWGNADNQTTPYLLANSSLDTVSGHVLLSTASGADPAYYDVILSTTQLQNISSTGLDGNYLLGADIDASATTSWKSGMGFDPIGDDTSSFTGSLDGLGHSITGLTIDRSGSSYVGLFGYTQNASLSNIALVGSNITGLDYVGALVGFSNNSTITNVSVTGNVSGRDSVAGLVGYNNASTVSNAYTTSSVQGVSYIGGLVGYNNASSTISNAYATGSVTGEDTVGGLVGYNRSSTISNVYATGNVTGSSHFVGGLVGFNGAGTISNAYASGKVSDVSYTGALVGANGTDSMVTNAFWNTETSAQSSGIGFDNNGQTVIGLTSSEMQNPLIYIDAGWDFASVWGKSNNSSSPENSGYMMLRGVGVSDELYDDYVRLSDTNKTYGDANPSLSGITLDGSGTSNVSLDWGSAITTTTDAGSYAYSDSNVVDVTTTSANGVYVDYGAGALIIDQAALTVTVNNDSKTYDGAAYSGGNGAAYSGFVNGETNNVLTGTLVYGGTSQGAVDAGNYTLSASGLTSGNYAITYVDGALTVDQAALTITANNDSKTYDGVAYSGGNGVGYAGFVGSEDSSVLSGTLAYGGSAQNAVDAGNYTLTAAGLTSDNYAITYVDGALIVDQAALTITANNDSKTYDGAAYTGGNGVGYAGFVGGEDETALGGTLNYGGSAQNAVNAGNYTLSASGLTSGNYAITYVDGALTVDQVALTVTTNNDSKTYDGTAYTGGNGVGYAGFVSGEDETALGGTLNYGGTALNAVDAGSYTLSAFGLISGNYAITYVDGSLTVDQVALTITANNDNKTYDGMTYTGGNGVGYSGFVAGEDSSVLGGTLAYGGTAQNAVDAGSYTLTAAGLTSGNYAITYVDGALTVDQAALTITANNDSKTYDGAAYTGGNGVGYSGFVAGEDSSVLGGTLAYGGTAQGAVNAGNYTLTASGLTADNYNIVFHNGTLTVNNSVSAPADEAIKQTLQFATSPSDTGILSSQKLIVVAEGIRLPENVLNDREEK